MAAGHHGGHGIRSTTAAAQAQLRDLLSRAQALIEVPNQPMHEQAGMHAGMQAGWLADWI
eukprot:COSAG01_NODE_50804_length_360_cov_0.789272_1_plen_59_part_01